MNDEQRKAMFAKQGFKGHGISSGIRAKSEDSIIKNNRDSEWDKNKAINYWYESTGEQRRKLLAQFEGHVRGYGDKSSRLKNHSVSELISINWLTDLPEDIQKMIIDRIVITIGSKSNR